MLIPVLVFILGAIIGSFLNVCICRIPKNESIVFPASHCPKCNKPIKWYDNIPIISYLLLHARCRNCKQHISLEYLLVESLNALIYTALYLNFGFSPLFFIWAFVMSILIVISFIDFHSCEIYDVMSFGLIISGVVLSLVFPVLHNQSNHLHSLFISLKGAAVAGAMIFLLRIFGSMVFKKEAMGEGDIFLALGLGAFSGWANFCFLLFAGSLVGLVIGIILRIIKGEEYIPFGPYLSIGMLCSIFFAKKFWSFLLLN